MNKFSEISHKPLRTYNRCVFAANLNSDVGPNAAQEYFDIFSRQEQDEMYMMYALIKKIGTKRVINLVTSGMEFSNEDYKGEPAE